MIDNLKSVKGPTINIMRWDAMSPWVGNDSPAQCDKVMPVLKLDTLILIILLNKFICDSTELDSHVQYMRTYKIQGNANATLRDTQRDTYKDYLFR